MKRFKLNEIVRIIEHKDCKVNSDGRVNSINGDVDTGKTIYHVSNMNMPFVGTVSKWFKESELDKIFPKGKIK